MQVSLLDWGLVICYFVFALLIGVYFSRRAGRDIGEYFVSGRSMPWWLAGTSMVATTFAADTPLAVNQFVYEHGIAGNWIWWCLVMNGMLTVFLFARLWRRVGVLTDIEFAELRYGGRPAAFLRGFRAIYLGLIANCIVMGWVICAMISIVGISLNVNKWTAVLICLGITVLYSGLSGLWGVMVTDFFQFIIAMTGSIALALYALGDVGWISGLKERMISQYGAEHAEAIFRFTPEVGSAWMPVLLFLVYIAVQWWASWYPGAEPGGGGYIAQRMFSAKDERHSLLATLWFDIAHYALRPWPWILVGLVSLVLLPGLEKPQEGYVMLMLRCLPTGFLGIMLAALAAAFMSTISTHLNWGSSYIINDFYKRFVRRDAGERHYVMASRLVTLGLMVIAGGVGYLMESIKSGWELLLTIGAGTGLVLILRWYWWRVNAWSEISSMIAALAVSLALRFSGFAGKVFPSQPEYAIEMIITVIVTTGVWLFVTYLTRPESESVLEKFFLRARPAGPGWKRFREKMSERVSTITRVKSSDNLLWNFLDWIAGCVLVYMVLFGIGKIILGHYLLGATLLVIGALAGGFIYIDLSRRGWKKVVE
jgi:SSS family solute:Na+ symporter